MARRTKVERDLETIGKALARVASAADRNAPGIICEGVICGTVHGERFEIPGIGTVYALDDGNLYLKNNYGQETDLDMVPGITRVLESLKAYAARGKDRRVQDAQMAAQRILGEEAERIRNWRPRALTAALEQERRERERIASGPGPDDPGYFEGM